MSARRADESEERNPIDESERKFWRKVRGQSGEGGINKYPT